jgi:hypothetical protein
MTKLLESKVAVVAGATRGASSVVEMQKAGLRFRNDIETGPGGKQIRLDDPDGNPVELFEPAK